MVVCPCDIHKMSSLLTGKKGQLKKRNSLRHNDDQFWIWPISISCPLQPYDITFVSYITVRNTVSILFFSTHMIQKLHLERIPKLYQTVEKIKL